MNKNDAKKHIVISCTRILPNDPETRVSASALTARKNLELEHSTRAGNITSGNVEAPNIRYIISDTPACRDWKRVAAMAFMSFEQSESSASCVSKNADCPMMVQKKTSPTMNPIMPHRDRAVSKNCAQNARSCDECSNSKMGLSSWSRVSQPAAYAACVPCAHGCVHKITTDIALHATATNAFA